MRKFRRASDRYVQNPLMSLPVLTTQYIRMFICIIDVPYVRPDARSSVFISCEGGNQKHQYLLRAFFLKCYDEIRCYTVRNTEYHSYS